MKQRHILLLLCLLVAGWLAFFADKTPEQAISEPVRQAIDNSTRQPVNNPSAPVAAVAKDNRQIRLLTIRPRLETQLAGQKINTNLFLNQSWAPPPPPAAKPPPPQAPVAPPLPFNFIGKKWEESSWEIYLSQGDQIILAKEKTVIAGMYQVESIRPPQMVLLYLPLKQTQTLDIGEAN